MLFFGLFFGLAGGFGWLRGWSFIGLLIVGQSLSALYVGRKNPELLKRRGQIGKGTKSWDFVLLGFFGLAYLAILVVAALDAQYQWSPMSVWLWPVGVLLYAFYDLIITWSMSARVIPLIR